MFCVLYGPSLDEFWTSFYILFLHINVLDFKIISKLIHVCDVTYDKRTMFNLIVIKTKHFQVTLLWILGIFLNLWSSHLFSYAKDTLRIKFWAIRVFLDEFRLSLFKIFFFKFRMYLRFQKYFMTNSRLRSDLWYMNYVAFNV